MNANNIVQEARQIRQRVEAFKAEKMAKREPLLKRLDEIEAERARIGASAVDRATLIKRAHEEIDIIADRYLASLVTVNKERCNRPVTVDQILIPSCQELKQLSFMLRNNSRTFGETGGEPLTQDAATFIFRDAMKKAARTQIMALPFPVETDRGVDINSARTRLRELEEEADAIRCQLEVIHAQIEEIDPSPKATKREHVGEKRRANFGDITIIANARGGLVSIAGKNRYGAQITADYSADSVSTLITQIDAVISELDRSSGMKKRNARGEWWQQVLSVDGSQSFSVGQKADASFISVNGYASMHMIDNSVRVLRGFLSSVLRDIQ